MKASLPALHPTVCPTPTMWLWTSLYFLDLGFLPWKTKDSPSWAISKVPSGRDSQDPAILQPGELCCQLLLTLGTSLLMRLIPASTNSTNPWPLCPILSFLESRGQLLLRLGFKTRESIRNSSPLKTNPRTVVLPGVGRSCFFSVCSVTWCLLIFYSVIQGEHSIFCPLQIPASWARGPLWILPLWAFFISILFFREISRKEYGIQPNRVVDGHQSGLHRLLGPRTSSPCWYRLKIGSGLGRLTSVLN